MQLTTSIYKTTINLQKLPLSIVFHCVTFHKPIALVIVSFCFYEDVMFKILVTLSFLYLIQGCASIEKLQSDPWLKSQSNNFTLYSKLNETENKSILENLEAFRALINLTNKNNNTRTFPTEIYVMSKDEASLFDISKNTGGFFDNNLDKNIIYLRYYKKTQHMISTILHEYVHYVHAQKQASFPRWFEEGTAEYLSGVEIANDKLILGAIQKGRLAWLSYEKWLPAKSIINPGEMSDWTGTNLSMFYAQSWLITFYLNNRELPQGQSYSTQLNNYINALHKGDNKITAFESAFNLKIDKVNRNLKTYWKRGKFKKLSLNKSILLKGVHIESQQLSQGEINLMLGKFSYSREQTKQSIFYFDNASNFEAQRDNALIGKAKTLIVNEAYDEASNLLQKVNGKEADLSELHFAKAQLNYALGEKSDDNKTKLSFAKKSLKELVSAWKLDKTNAKIYYFYGVISLHYDLDIERAVSMLEEAVYHNPSNIGLKVMLFRAKILTNHKQSYEYGQRLLASFNSEYHLSAVDELNDLIEIAGHYQEYTKEKNFKSWAISQNGYYGFSYGFSNQTDADKAAIKYCISDRKDANDCQVIERKNGNSQAFKTWFKLQILDDIKN